MKDLSRASAVFLFFALIVASCAHAKETINSKVDADVAFVLKSEPSERWFVVISDANELEYVQFGRERYGFMLYWPVAKKKPREQMLQVANALRQVGYKAVGNTATRQDVLGLETKTFVSDEAGLYANVGSDSDSIIKLVRYLFKNIYNFTDYGTLTSERGH